MRLVGTKKTKDFNGRQSCCRCVIALRRACHRCVQSYILTIICTTTVLFLFPYLLANSSKHDTRRLVYSTDHIRNGNFARHCRLLLSPAETQQDCSFG